MDGFEFVDAGVIDNVPLKPAIEEGVDKIIVVVGSHPKDPPPPIKNNLEWALWLIDIAHAHNVFADIETAKKINRSEDREKKGYKFVDLTLMAPPNGLDLNVTDFHKRNLIRETLKLGYQDGMRLFNSKVRSGEVELEEIVRTTFKEEGGGRTQDLSYQWNPS
jgi:predicted patatin/cPLA2 family phospholipase